MADVDGNRLAVGDRVEIVAMDDPMNKHLIGVQGVVDTLPGDDDPVREDQAFLVLDHSTIPALSTQQSMLRKLAADGADGAGASA
jgi:hypothetical protein